MESYSSRKGYRPKAGEANPTPPPGRTSKSPGVDYSEIVRWCAEECTRQESGEMSVSRMFDAWQFALNLYSKSGVMPTYEHVVSLGMIVENIKNNRGIRTGPVAKHIVDTVNGVPYGIKSIGVAPHMIENALQVHTMPERIREGKEHPAEWYRVFEEIHPFADGNGRVGSILYNWLNRTLLTPEVPPDFWGRR